ncbi:hypothetical protein [Thiothrix subterranea]|uniref:Uncharacterized protein n=1 Tax=Thiothrix subterranea TaxID=2735563 RepID=A0AA51QZJ8_9GAMM|nr:hypothetical protein [Thiothrix subterranea]MDQ5769498.1 hypothetical protein [Thiothrix subterranea]WML87082.1 hypothetical protein RCG00_01695 [Thiothrix subterranea]
MLINLRQTALHCLTFLLLLQLSAVALASDGGVTYRVAWDATHERYRVYLRPSSTPSPDLSLTGQITLRVPHGTGEHRFSVTDIQSKSGTSWSLGSHVIAPPEDPSVDYLSFAFIPLDVKAFAFKAGEEQEAFSFKNAGPCIGAVALLDNATDPFNQPPTNPKNSTNTNPSNQFANTGWGSSDDNDYLGNDGTPASCATECLSTPAAPLANNVYYRVDWSKADQRYHVYMYPGSTPTPDMSLSSQVTLKMPHASGAESFKVSAIKSTVNNITWTESSRINAPKEDNGVDYLSFTMTPSDAKAFQWQAGREREVFSFANDGACLGPVALLDNANDPFNALPNSMGTNPGNQFANLGWGAADSNNYAGNYGCAATCITPTTPKLQARVLLQGAFDSSTKLMRDTLRTKNQLPSTSPYDATDVPMLGSATLANAVLTTTGNNAPVDWVLLELRDATNPTLVKARVTGVVQRDGDIVDAQTGENTFELKGLQTGNYYLSAHHRNHLGVMSATAVNVGETPVVVDFSQEATRTYGEHARVIATGAALLWAGNTSSDERIIAQGPTNDSSTVLSDVLLAAGNSALTTNYKLNGYQATDANMDGLTIFAGPSNDVDLLLGNVLLHPVNSTTSANYIIRQQLP